MSSHRTSELKPLKNGNQSISDNNGKRSNGNFANGKGLEPNGKQTAPSSDESRTYTELHNVETDAMIEQALIEGYNTSNINTSFSSLASNAVNFQGFEPITTSTDTEPKAKSQQLKKARDDVIHERLVAEENIIRASQTNVLRSAGSRGAKLDEVKICLRGKFFELKNIARMLHMVKHKHEPVEENQTFGQDLIDFGNEMKAVATFVVARGLEMLERVDELKQKIQEEANRPSTPEEVDSDIEQIATVPSKTPLIRKREYHDTSSEEEAVDRKKARKEQKQKWHEIVHTVKLLKPAKSGKIPCPHCATGFLTKRSLRDHMCRHANITFCCQNCNKEFITKSSFDNHMGSHKKEQLKQVPTCSICNAQFPLQSSLTNHMRTHSDTKDRCELCGRTYSSRSAFLDHIRDAHVDGKRHICEFCGTKFQTKNAVWSHISRNHVQIRKGCQIIL